MSKHITSSHKDQLIEDNFILQGTASGTIRMHCSNGFAHDDGKEFPEIIPNRVPTALIKGKGSKPKKQTTFVKHLALFLEAYEYILALRAMVYIHPSYAKDPNLLYFSFKNPRTRETCILELNLERPSSHIRLRCLSPKHNNHTKPQSQTEQIYTMLTIETIHSYV